MNQKTRLLSALVLAAGSLLASVTGCELIAAVDRSTISGGSGGSGGSAGMTTSTSGHGGATASTGGMTTGTGGSGGTSGTGGSGGACATTACTAPADCPAPANECIVRACNTGCCGTTNVADLTATKAGQTAGDCQSQVCDGKGALEMVADNSDTPAAMDACHAPSCTAGVPTQTPVAGSCAVGGTICGDPAGANAGKCVACNVTADCTGMNLCDPGGTGVCISPLCTDNLKDGTETDKDCGGATCAPCADTLKCVGNTDCSSGYCLAGICTAPSCTDSATNGNETDKDCGGTGFNGAVACPKCADTKICKVSGDCTNGFCDATVTPHVCKTPTCADGQKNGGETGIDCGGALCDGQGKTCGVGLGCTVGADCASGDCSGGVCILQTQGGTCGTDAQCATGHCTDGVCCDTACTSANGCASCALPGQVGTCSTVAAGTSIAKTTCALTSPATCGTNGLCNGSNACQDYAASTSCGATACANGILTPLGSCSGSGTCNAGSGAACAGGFACANQASCKTACSADADCASASSFCQNPGASGTCVAKAAPGGTCSANNACTSAVCGTTGSGNCCTATCGPIGGACGATGCDATGACVFPGNTVAPAGLQTPGDCQKIACNGAGGLTSVDDATDLPTSSSVCLTNPSCSGSPLTPAFAPAPTGSDCTADNQSPKHVCGTTASPVFAGTCVQCNVDADCNAINDAGTLSCANHVCQ